MSTWTFSGLPKNLIEISYIDCHPGILTNSHNFRHSLFYCTKMPFTKIAEGYDATTDDSYPHAAVVGDKIWLWQTKCQ